MPDLLGGIDAKLLRDRIDGATLGGRGRVAVGAAATIAATATIAVTGFAVDLVVQRDLSFMIQITDLLLQIVRSAATRGRVRC